MSVEDRFKALDEARKKMEEKIAEARKEYVETKLKLFPELKTAGIPPSKLGEMMEEKDRKIAELEEKVKLLEQKLKEVGGK